MSNSFQMLKIEEIELDLENPRIAHFMEIYNEEPQQINAEALSLALGAGVDAERGTTFTVLQESIKAQGGIINPIIVNKKGSKYVVIEGNTRVQIYKDFKKNAQRDGQNAENWNTIPAIVYTNMTDEQIHAIRLQAHLVGPREWDPYAKAKYLNDLSNNKKLPMNSIIAFCGGKVSEIKKNIDAYNDMENYYRPLLNDAEFDQKQFSKFVEMQNKRIKDALVETQHNRSDYAKWVIDGNIDNAQNVRKLPFILKNEEATKTFLHSDITEAYKTLAIDEEKSKKFEGASYDMLAAELLNNLRVLAFSEVKNLENNPSYEEKKELLHDLYDELKSLIEAIDRE